MSLSNHRLYYRRGGADYSCVLYNNPDDCGTHYFGFIIDGASYFAPLADVGGANATHLRAKINGVIYALHNGITPVIPPYMHNYSAPSIAKPMYIIAYTSGGYPYQAAYGYRFDGSGLTSLPGLPNTASLFETGIASDGSIVAIGRTYPGSNQYVYRWTGSVWSSIQIPSINYFACTARSPNGVLYIGGATEQASTNGGVYKWTGSTWSPVGTGTFTNLSPVSGLFAETDTTLYATGSFSTIGGVAVNRMAYYNGSSWTSFGGTGIPSGQVGYGITKDVYGMLYVVGNFTSINGVTATYVAKWDGSSWSKLGDGTCNGTYCNKVTASRSGKVYVSGDFTTIGGVSASGIACYDPKTDSWSALGSGITPGGSVSQMVCDNNSLLYVVGKFISAGGVANTNNLARWSGYTWTALGPGLSAPYGAGITLSV